VDFFKDKDFIDFLDKYILMKYYKKIFKLYYGIDNIKDLIWRIIELYINDTIIDMANINNRRVIMIEYLIRPIMEMYTRLLFGITSRKQSEFFPSINERVVLVTGFKNLMHLGNLYDISIPYPAPLINKISQNIMLIKDKLPKSWVRNDFTTYGIFDPIGVSAQKTAMNLYMTNNTLIHKYGKIYLNTLE
jgi:hypothetical protein